MLLATLMTLAPAADVGNCPIERARYVLHGEADVSAGFVRVRGPMSALGFYLDLKAAKRRFWFIVGSGNGSGMVDYIEPSDDPTGPDGAPVGGELTTNPMSLMEIAAAGPDRHFTQDQTFGAGERAPANLFIPKLTAQLWYDSGVSPKPAAPIAFLEFAGCRADDRAPPAPTR